MIPGFDFGYTDKYGYHEGLLKGKLNTDNIINSGYGKDYTIYTANGAWISKVPQKATVLSKVNNDDNFYVSGWWPNHNKVKGQVMAMTQPIGNSRVTLFANTIINKDHPQHNYRQMANAIFASMYNPDAKVVRSGNLVKITEVENNKVYDKAVKPVIEAPDKLECTVELDGVPWDGMKITKEGKHNLLIKLKDHNGNEANDTTSNETPQINYDKSIGVDCEVGTGNDNKEQDESGNLLTTGYMRALEYVMVIGGLLILVGIFTIFIRERKTKANK